MIIDNNKIVNICLIINNNKVNFLDIIKKKGSMLKRAKHVDNIISFDSNFKFYLIRDVNNYVLAVNNINDKSIEKIRYSLNGVVINRVIDRLFNDKIIRKIGEKEISLDYNNKVLSTKLNIKLKPIIKYSTKKTSFTENPNIGVIDLETFLGNDGIQKIYALGFKTNLDPNPVHYYISKDNMDPGNIVLSMFDELLRDKYDKFTFYCHNLSGYDVVYIMSIINNYNNNNNNNNDEDKYDYSCNVRNNKIITIKIIKGKKSFIIKDSYCILNNNLRDLGKSFDVSVLKGIFPYKFAKEDNLFYVWNTPKFQYYEDITIEEYNKMYSENWSFCDETVKYLLMDLNCLYEIIKKANKQIFLDYDVNMSDNNTISGLALRIFLKKYYNDNIPFINKSSIYKDIKGGYYGGITEVYKPYDENLFYFDVNSLYPFVAFQDMPGLECTKVEYFNDKQNINDLFGFFYCSIMTPLDGYLGLLPLRTKSGINFPKGKWEGWYFSEELKFAEKNGYNIKVIKGYIFNRDKNTFKSYINKINSYYLGYIANHS